jgi:hypothetical protein
MSLVTIIISTSCGGLGGAVFSYFFTPRREAAARKRTFRGYIKSVKAELSAIDLGSKTGGDDLVRTHKATVSGVRSACCDVSDDVPSPQFQASWESYCGLTEADIVQRKPFNKDKLLDDQLYEWAESHYDLGREKMFALLDDLIRCAR